MATSSAMAAIAALNAATAPARIAIAPSARSGARTSNPCRAEVGALQHPAMKRRRAYTIWLQSKRRDRRQEQPDAPPVEPQPGAAYLTDEAGNRLTDPAGNLIVEG